MKSLVLLLLVSLLGGLTGCVSSGKHRTLELEYQTTREILEQQIAERDARLQELERQLVQARTRISGLDYNVADREKRIAALEEEVVRLRNEYANVMSDRARLQASAEELRQVLRDAAQRRREAEGRVAQFQQLVDRFKVLSDSGKLRVKLERGRMMLELPSDVLFPSGSARLSPQGQATIDQVTEVLKTISNREIQVEGHTDAVPISNERYTSNWHLGSGRALVVVERMIAQGLPSGQVSAASFGESRPAQSNDSAEGKAANRRIEIVLVPDLSTLPGTEEIEAILQK